MPRTIVTISPSATSQGSGIINIDTANGNHIDFSNSAIAALLEKFPLHVLVSNTAGAGSVTVRAGYGPWALQMSQGDLVIPIGANTVTDIGPQIVLARHSKDNFGSLDLDYSVVSGTLMVVLANSAPVPANTAQNAIIKHLPGYLVGAVVTTVGTAALSHYDHQGASAGNVLHSIPGSAALGSLYAPMAIARNGITAAGLASGPGVTVFYT